GDMLPIATALGFRPDQSMGEGWAVLNELAEASAAGAERRRQLQNAVDLQNYQFNTHGVELGQHYNSDAVAPDGTNAVAPTRDPGGPRVAPDRPSRGRRRRPPLHRPARRAGGLRMARAHRKQAREETTTPPFPPPPPVTMGVPTVAETGPNRKNTRLRLSHDG